MTDRGPAVTFGGASVVLLESRLASETAAMVQRLGGAAVSAPSLAEVELDADAAIAGFIEQLPAAAGPVVVFLTGAAVTRLFAAADRLGRSADLRAGLAGAFVVARGPKPAGALARREVSPSRLVPEPFTTADVINTLETVPVDCRDVTVVHYGERSEPLVAYLSARGARVYELMLYQWQLPSDTGPLSRAVDALIAGEIDVLAFTSQIQIRHLLEVAGPRGPALVAALNTTVLVGAVGPTCAAACAAAGIRGVVMPERPKLGPLFHALAVAHTARHRTSSPSSTPRSSSDQ